MNNITKTVTIAGLTYLAKCLIRMLITDQQFLISSREYSVMKEVQINNLFLVKPSVIELAMTHEAQPRGTPASRVLSRLPACIITRWRTTEFFCPCLCLDPILFSLETSLLLEVVVVLVLSTQVKTRLKRKIGHSPSNKHPPIMSLSSLRRMIELQSKVTLASPPPPPPGSRAAVVFSRVSFVSRSTD